MKITKTEIKIIAMLLFLITFVTLCIYNTAKEIENKGLKGIIEEIWYGEATQGKDFK